MTGLLALGDSITVGEGNMVLGTPCRSWALWLAGALDLPFTSYAVNGSVVAAVEALQLPRVRKHYELACLYVGVNDVRQVDFDGAAFARDYAACLAHVAAHADRVLVLTLPADLGRPRAGATKISAANWTIRAAASAHGAVVCSLDDFAGWLRVQPDTVHPTALGQVEIARRAARALGIQDADLPHTRVNMRGRLSYARTHLWLSVGDRRRRVVEALVWHVKGRLAR